MKLFHLIWHILGFGAAGAGLGVPFGFVVGTMLTDARLAGSIPLGGMGLGIFSGAFGGMFAGFLYATYVRRYWRDREREAD